MRTNAAAGGLTKKAHSKAVGGDDVLYGWKSIADCLKCSTKTAQRLEKREALPILRPDKRKKWRVLALRRSLIAWMTGGVESVALTGSSLVAFDRRTRVLWSHEFRQPLRGFSPEEIAWRARTVDLNGGGERGVLFAARFLSPSHIDTLYYFSPNGKILWQLEADPPLRDREGRSFDRAWCYKHLVTTPAMKGTVVWAALGNESGWAGCVLRIGADGTAAVQLANAGYVERLCRVSLPEGDCLIACGENNDYDDAFVALLGVHDPPAFSVPGERAVYRYANAPNGHPRKYILFPKTELIVARNKPYGHALRITEHADGVIVEVESGGDGAYMRYHFSMNLDPRYVFPSGSHEFAHGQLEQGGAIRHPWRECPELENPLVLRIWEPDSGWYERPIPWRDNPWKELRRPNP